MDYKVRVVEVGLEYGRNRLATANQCDLVLSSPKEDMPFAQRLSLLSVDAFPMCQHWYEAHRVANREGLGDTGATFELFYNIATPDRAALEFDWGNPHVIASLTDEQVVAPRFSGRDCQCRAVHVHDHA